MSESSIKMENEEPVLFSPKQKATFVRYLEAQQMAGLELEDVITILSSEEYVEERQVG